MKDDQNGRRPKWKTTKMEDDQNGRRPKWKTTKMKDNQNGRQPKSKTTKMEDDQNGRRPKWKTTKMEVNKMENNIKKYKNQEWVIIKNAERSICPPLRHFLYKILIVLFFG